MRSSLAGRLLVAIAFCVSLTGLTCTKKSSIFVDTNEMEVSFSATSTGSGDTLVRASLSTEDVLLNSSPSVKLSSRDALRVTSVDPVAGVQDIQLMVGMDVGSRYRYETTVLGSAKDTRIEVDLDRSRSGGVSAPDSFVTLPTPFELDWVEDPVTLEPAPINFSRSASAPLFVVWDPFDAPDFDPGDVLSYRITGDCIRIFSGVIDWEGGEDALELTGGALRDLPPPNDGQSCPIEVRFTLTRRGTTDSEYLFGRFNAYQIRELELQSMP